ncbi:MAG TPA: hypothetical protein VGZ22_17425, partial [Isosphaeraceae bacterium]|nr:hypothetical protein [Isosphaeraceae bacterium]
ELVNCRDCIDLAWNARDASFFAAIFLAHSLPSYRDRYEIRANVLFALAGLSYSSSLFGEIPPIMRNWNRNLGAQAAPKNPANTGAIDPKDPALFPEHWKCDPLTAKYVRRFLRLAAKHHIPVFWLMPPICPNATVLREQKGLEAPYTFYVQGIQRHFPGVVVLDGRRAGYPHTVYQDPVHLDRQGAEALSTDVAGLLDVYLNGPAGAPRWASLPSFRERPTGGLIEDVAQSRVALKMP